MLQICRPTARMVYVRVLGPGVGNEEALRLEAKEARRSQFQA